MTEHELLEQAQHLISIPSTTENPRARQDALDVIVGMLNAHPEITVEHFTHNGSPSILAYIGEVRPERFAVILNGHVDVVIGKPDQFTPVIKNGRLYGRGAHDMKTAALVMTDVFIHTANTLPYPVGLQMVTDEEKGGLDGTKWQVEQGVRSDFVIIGEHNFQKNAIYNASRGLRRVDVLFRGTSAHGGYVWHGDNALLRATTFAHKLLKHYPIPESERWCTTVNIADLHASETIYNRVPDSARLHLEFRFIPEDPNFKNRQSVRKFLYGVGPDIQMEFGVSGSAVYVPTDDPYIEILADVTGQECGEPPVFLSRYGSGDGRFYTEVGCNAVEYGILGNGPHSDDEYAVIQDIASYQRILEQFLKKAADVKTQSRRVLAAVA